MSNEIHSVQKDPHSTKRNLIAFGAITVFFCIALFNVYSFFQEKRQTVLEEQARVQTQIEADKQARAEAERKAKLEQEIKLQELALEKEEKQSQLLQRKVQSQKRLEQYHLLKQARRASKEDKRLQRRVEHARKLDYPEGLPRKMVDGIKSATYLTIRNNPKDYIGNYTPRSILKTSMLTKGGANGLMLFSMVSEDLKAIKEVIEIGHEVNTQNKSGYTALMFAGAYNTPEVVKFLIKSGAELNVREYLTQGNALHVTARHNPKPETIQALVEQGFDLEVRDTDGNTALLLAVKHNQNLQVVQQLIELGADTTAGDNTGRVAYSYAYERINKRVPMGRYEIISSEYQQEVLVKLKPN